MSTKSLCYKFLLSKWFLLILGYGLLILPAHAQSNLNGVIDFHAHSGPDGVPRAIDADDLARLAKERGMRGLVLKNHWEPTDALAYVLRKEVPGLEIFGGIALNLSVGGMNLEAVKHMIQMKGGWGRVVWFPTFDSENAVRSAKEDRPFVAVSKDGHLVPEAMQVIDLIAQHPELVLETGHISPEEGLMVVREAKRRGVKHVVVTHAMRAPVWMKIPQMVEAAQNGAYIEFVYSALTGAKPDNTVEEYAKAIREIGPKYCILATDLGGVAAGRPSHPDGMLMFMEALRMQGISQADIDMMSKTNPALMLGLQ
jgi:hypothetical protein